MKEIAVSILLGEIAMSLRGLLFSVGFSLCASFSHALTIDFPMTPGQTLKDLNEYLIANYKGGNVIINIAGKTYSESVSWTFQPSSGSLKFTAKDPAKMPVFDGCYKGCLLGEAGGFFMRLQNKSTSMKNVYIQRIKIKNYTNGILIAKATNVTISGMIFENLGTAFNNAAIPLVKNSKGEMVPQWGGYSALMTDLSTAIKVTNNKFSNNYNNDSPLWFHAVYLKSTADSYVLNNNIKMVSGDPIRLRHGCSNVRISGNTIVDSGMSPVTTFEDAGEECPSAGIKAVSNTYGMMFPYNKIFSQAGFNKGWSKKAYISEGMVLGQGYKVTVDPLKSPAACENRGVKNKWQVFTSKTNTFELPATDARNLAKSVGVTTGGSGGNTYVTMAANSLLVMNTNMFFVGCNSDKDSTCDDRGTTSLVDDRDDFNEDSNRKIYAIRLKVRTATISQKIQVSGGSISAATVTISPTANDSTGWATIELPVKFSGVDRNKTALTIKTLGSGMKIHSVQLIETN